MVEIGLVCWIIGIAFITGAFIGYGFNAYALAKERSLWKEYKSKMELYKNERNHLRTLIHNLNDNDVEILQKDYATWVIIKDMDDNKKSELVDDILCGI